MSGDAAEILESFRKAGHPVMTASPNDYAAVRSDVIAGSPAGSALYDVLDQEVPFYQIVFRGRIPLALSPINMAGNLTDRYLQAVATGTSLYFTLSQSYEDRFAYSTQSALLASLYGDNRDRILSMLEESAAFYKAADGCRIVGYSRLADGVTRTDFDNGVSVVVNRTDSPVQSPLGTVDARSFVYAG